MRSIRISPRAVALTLAAAISILVIASTLGQISTYYFGHGRLFGLVRLFALDEEGNVPTWYSAVALLGCSALLGLVALDARARVDRWHRHWAALAVIFLYLSIDEAASIHELSIEPLHGMLGVGGLLRWAWVIPGMLAVAALGIAYSRFVLALPAATRRLFVAAAATFLTGALLVEMLSGPWVDRYGEENMGYALLWTAEEALEMSGVAVLAYALLAHLERLGVSFAVHIGTPAGVATRPVRVSSLDRSRGSRSVTHRSWT